VNDAADLRQNTGGGSLTKVDLRDQPVRQALRFAERELDIERLLLREELRTAGGEIFLDRYGELVNLSASGQLAMRRIFEAHLERVEWRVRSAARL
jgi:hypothetical protein